MAQARQAMRGLGFLAGALLVAALPLAAEEIQLRSGGRISGVVVEKTDRTITIETGPGQVTIPLSLVDKIVSSHSAIEVWQERSSALGPGDAQGWADLARWAEAQGLETQARTAWRRVLTADPKNAEANAALGRVLMDGTWMSQEAAYRAQGLVPYRGRWVTPAEHDALLRQDVAESAAARSQREAEARVREAEARAQEAEARARAAEVQAQYSDGGIPVYPGYGCSYGCGGYGYGYGGVVVGYRVRRVHEHGHFGTGFSSGPLVPPASISGSHSRGGSFAHTPAGVERRRQ